MITFEVESEEFIEWVDGVSSSFKRMVETMKNVGELIRLQTIPLVPLDNSDLEQSFTYVTMNHSPFILLAVGFDAVDEESGFHYAQYQHDVIKTSQHPKRGVQFYLTEGIRGAKGEAFHLIEQDYLSLFDGGTVGRGRTNIDPQLNERFVFLDLEHW